MDSRREFIKKAALLSGAAGVLGMLPESIQKAMAINPETGSTYLDAEHIVVLMQENRSFDHCYGTLRGVRGYNDPNPVTLPNKNKVWLQTNREGETYTPFRLNIKDTKATWMSALPHSWENQVDARNEGRYNKWLDVKRSGNKDYSRMPLTMGYYDREDIPFYYALADAFTLCDQNFCSSLTGTTPNRLYLWSGTIREKPSINSKANVHNSDVTYDKEATWKTFPERLEENNISWRIYQNELSLPMGFTGEEEEWLANFTDNPIEWFTQYHVRFSTGFNKFLKKMEQVLPGEIAELEKKLNGLPASGKEAEETKKLLEKKKTDLTMVRSEAEKWSKENFDKLSEHEKNLHKKAFTTNINDPDYHQVATLNYDDNGTAREMKVPKGDILHQFREDVKNKKLPTISWVVAPENFSDHPGAPWYGAWYISEVMDILTENPEVWKKTIFIVCYDENDGYFDHVPPFVAPHPDKHDGLVSEGIDVSVEHVSLEQEYKRYKPEMKQNARGGTIGLGYRVPLLIASPWSRGGYVNSEVCDHTSILQLMENFLSHKTGKKIEESNISAWRRTVCGDLSSVFRPYNGEKIPMPAFPEKDKFVESIHKAKFKKAPSNFRPLTKEEIAEVNRNPHQSVLMPKQEAGVRLSCALPYQLYADGKLDKAQNAFSLTLSAKNEIFGKKSAGSPFNVYAPGKYLVPDKMNEGQSVFQDVKAWAYAVKAGDQLTDSYPLSNFENGEYHLRVDGPNGFIREFWGNAQDPSVETVCDYELDARKKPTGKIVVRIKNTGSKKYTVRIKDNAYKTGDHTQTVTPGGRAAITLDPVRSFGWYDFSLQIEGVSGFKKRYVGRVETGKDSKSDPLMGGVAI